MFFAHFRKAGKDCGGLYPETVKGWRAYHDETFSPDVEKVSFILFRVTGKTYAERQSSLYNIALAYQEDSANYPFSYYELATIGAWMERNARRYGLLREFRENCIC